MANAIRSLMAVFLLMCVFSARAQTQFYGDWSTGQTSSGDGFYAATINDSGNVLGQYCFPSAASCVYLLGMVTRCTKGKQYPVLVNATTGSFETQVYCGGPLEIGRYQYVFTQFDLMDNAVKKGTLIGFAVPLADGRFKVVRFKLIGSSKAIAALRAIAGSQVRPARQGTRDQTF